MGFELNAVELKRAMQALSLVMGKNRDYLTELDSRSGDGDLGISMDNGYKAVVSCFECEDGKDLGRLLMQAAKAFNEMAPSSLGTITSFGLMGMAKALKGQEQASLLQLGEAMKKGLDLIMEKAGSKPGEKTILDSLCPAVEELLKCGNNNASDVFRRAADAAEVGMEETRKMKSLHGRAAYYGDSSIGHLDGGAVVGNIIFQTLAELTKDIN